MFFFLKLYLAHLIGDFVIQFDEIYQLKLKSLWGQFFHALIHAAVSLLLLLPYLINPGVWIFIFFIVDIHLFQDTVKYKLIKNKKLHFPVFIIDQVLHLLWIAAIIFIPVHWPSAGFSNKIHFSSFYFENRWTIYLIGWITATMAGSYILNSFSLSYLKDHRKDRFISAQELVYGFLERSIVAGTILFCPYPAAWLLTPATGLGRLAFPKLKSRAEFILSFIYAFGVGIFFRRLLIQ